MNKDIAREIPKINSVAGMTYREKHKAMRDIAGEVLSEHKI